METKFTPGPWKFLFGQTPERVTITTVPPEDDRVEGKGFDSKTIYVGNSNGEILANVKVFTTAGYMQDFDQFEGNAKLIAAAPEMFDVIKELYDWSINNNTRGPIFPKLEEIINKVTT